MKKLSAIDAGFLYSETAETPMHVSALQIYDPGPATTGSVSLDAIVENARIRTNGIGCFHQKLLEVPWHLDHPYWMHDADYDAARHITEIDLPSPGDWRALASLAARLHETPLDRNRPLWQMYVIRGLGPIKGFAPELSANAFAVLTKIHHAAVDGVAGIGVTAALHDLEPCAPQRASHPAEREDTPSPSNLLVRAAANDALRSIRTFGAWPRLLRLANAASASPTVPMAPQTRFNRKVSERRTFDAVETPLASLQQIKATVPGATINDVILSIVGGALRHYLLSRGPQNSARQPELPRRTMSALVPINTRKDMTQVGEGNQISQMIVPLATDIADPHERLRFIHRATTVAKRNAEQVATDASVLAELSPAPWTALAASSFSRFATNSAINPVMVNTVVTNVKGPPVPFYLCGAKLVKAYGLGPLGGGVGLFHTALSYCGNLTLTVTSCGDLLPDVERYADCLRAAYDELVD